MDTKSTKKQIKEAVSTLYDIQTKKINTLIRYDVCLGPEVRCALRKHNPIILPVMNGQGWDRSHTLSTGPMDSRRRTCA